VAHIIVGRPTATGSMIHGLAIDRKTIGLTPERGVNWTDFARPKVTKLMDKAIKPKAKRAGPVGDQAAPT